MASTKAKSSDKGRGRKATSDNAGHNNSRKFDFFGAVMPSDDFADYQEARYILNLMNQVSYTQQEAYAFMAAVEYNYGHLPDFPFRGEPDEEEPNRRTFRYTMSGNLGKVKAKDWQAIQKFMKARMERAVSDAPIEEKTPERLEALFILLEHLGLDEDVREICEFLHIYHTEMTFQKFYNDLCEANNRGGQAAAYFLGKPEKVDKFKKLLNRNGKLDDFGLIENKSFGNTIKDFVFLPQLDPNVLYKIIGLTDRMTFWNALSGKR